MTKPQNSSDSCYEDRTGLVEGDLTGRQDPLEALEVKGELRLSGYRIQVVQSGRGIGQNVVEGLRIGEDDLGRLLECLLLLGRQG